MPPSIWKLSIFCTWLQWLIFSAGAQELSTDFDSMAEAFCPPGSGVSNIRIGKGKNQYGEQDYRFTLKCVQVADAQDAVRSCRTKYAITIPYYDVGFDDQLKTCSCNEYLAGLKTYPYELKENGVVLARERRLHLRCCTIPTSSLTLGPCHYTGMRYLLSPWETELRAEPNKANETRVIQSLMLFSNYVVAKSCFYSRVSIASGYSAAADCRTKETDTKTDFLKCTMLKTSFQPFLDFSPSASNVSATASAQVKGNAYERQSAICQDGYHLSALQSKRVQNENDGKDYIFYIDCHPLTYHYCYCFWRPTCSDTDVQWYVAGWRSEWNRETKQRTFGSLCCTSPAVQIGHCETSRRISDGDTASNLASPHYRTRRQNAKIIKNINSWFENGTLLLTFDTCDIQLSEDKGCQVPCKSCFGTYDANASADPICTPSEKTTKAVVAETTSSTSKSTQAPRTTQTPDPDPTPATKNNATVTTVAATALPTEAHLVTNATAATLPSTASSNAIAVTTLSKATALPITNATSTSPVASTTHTPEPTTQIQLNTTTPRVVTSPETPKPTTQPPTSPKPTTLPTTSPPPPTTPIPTTAKLTSPPPTTPVSTTVKPSSPPPTTPLPTTLKPSSPPPPTTAKPTTPKPTSPPPTSPPPTTKLPLTTPSVTNKTTAIPSITLTAIVDIITTPTASTPITPTRPTCSASRIDGAEFCKKKIPQGKNVTDDCQTHCYAEDRGHYRGATCVKNSAKGLACECHYDPCRNSAMDIVFLLDSSGSLEDWGFKQETDFLKNFISKMTLGQNESRVALVQFSTGAQKIFTFTDPIQSQELIKKAIDNLYYDAGDTNITAGFVVATPILEATKRLGVPQVIVLVTDGIHNQGPPSPTVPASKLRGEGALIYAVGIGPEANQNHLRLITGDRTNVFMALFSNLNNVLNVIGAEVTATVNN